MPNVKIYALSTCPFCRKTKEFLNKNKIQFEEIDISVKENAQEMIKKSGQMGTPVLNIDGKIIVGYDLPKIKKALDIKQS
jgi:glutaredoxin-like YruB-family protein